MSLCTLWYIFTRKYEIFYVCVWKMYEMKINNLVADVKIFSICRKQPLFQAEFQQYKWKLWSSFLTDKLWPDIFWGVFVRGTFVQGVYVLEPFYTRDSNLQNIMLEGSVTGRQTFSIGKSGNDIIITSLGDHMTKSEILESRWFQQY